MSKLRAAQLLTGIAIITIGGVLLGTAWFGFYYLNDHCLVKSYSLADGCVTIVVNWVSLDETQQYQTNVGYKFNDGDCWTSLSYDQIMAYIQKEYPIGKNHSCYRADSWLFPPVHSSDEDKVYFSHQPTMTQDQAYRLVNIGIAMVIAGGVLLGAFVIFVICGCARQKNNDLIVPNSPTPTVVHSHPHSHPPPPPPAYNTLEMKDSHSYCSYQQPYHQTK